MIPAGFLRPRQRRAPPPAGRAMLTSPRSQALADRVPGGCPRDGCAIAHVRHLPANHDRGPVVEVRFTCGSVETIREQVT